MYRNKLPILFIVFLFSFLFVLGIIAKSRGWQHSNILFWGGQGGLVAGIIGYFLVPDKSRRE